MREVRVKPSSLAATVDDPGMAMFWTWAVRNPAVLLCALAIVSGAAGVADWSIALPVALVFGLMADAAHHLAHRARDRKARELAALAALRHRDPMLGEHHRRAA